MPASVTCHGHNQSAVQPLTSSSCLACPRGLTPRALPPLHVSDAKTTSCSVDIAEIADECTSPVLSVVSESSGTMAGSCHTVSSRTAPNSPGRRPSARRMPVNNSSTPMPIPPAHRRSVSCSTTRSGYASGRSSVRSHRPIPGNASLSSATASRRAPETRENLIALHREACRIFQSEDAPKPRNSDTQALSSPTSVSSTTYFSSHGGNTPTDTGSPSPSPVIHPLPDRFFDRDSMGLNDPRPSHHDARLASNFSGDSDAAQSRPTSTTVIDWTSPSTRKREYAKIDRANRGLRGLWRRVAPKWCQPDDHRTPFFEEGKNGKANYEGSVRRFRMDIPDEDPSSEAGLDGPRLAFGLRRKRAGSEDCLAGKRQSRWPCVGQAK